MRRRTTFWPLRSSLATMEARRPSMWWRASTTTTLAQRPEPETMVAGERTLPSADCKGVGEKGSPWALAASLNPALACSYPALSWPVSCLRAWVWSIPGRRHRSVRHRWRVYVNRVFPPCNYGDFNRQYFFTK